MLTAFSKRSDCFTFLFRWISGAARCHFEISMVFSFKSVVSFVMTLLTCRSSYYSSVFLACFEIRLTFLWLRFGIDGCRSPSDSSAESVIQHHPLAIPAIFNLIQYVYFLMVTAEEFQFSTSLILNYHLYRPLSIAISSF